MEEVKNLQTQLQEHESGMNRHNQDNESKPTLHGKPITETVSGVKVKRIGGRVGRGENRGETAREKI